MLESYFEQFFVLFVGFFQSFYFGLESLSFEFLFVEGFFESFILGGFLCDLFVEFGQFLFCLPGDGFLIDLERFLLTKGSGLDLLQLQLKSAGFFPELVTFLDKLDIPCMHFFKFFILLGYQVLEVGSLCLRFFKRICQIS